jgi:ABC-type amino acid transport substrate-binding protein
MHRRCRSTTPSGQPAGYSVDLCKRIATAVKEELKKEDLKVTFVPLTSADRLEAIVKNKADIECGPQP